MGFFSCTSKYILFIFNLVCALLGLAVLGVGVYGKVSSSSFGGEAGTSSIVIIVLGSTITVLAFFGCWGAIQENPCLLNTYGTILSILLLGLIAIGAIVMINKGKAEDNIKKYIYILFEEYHSNTASQKEVDFIQSSMHCCGIDGPVYWFPNIPASCCNGLQKCDLTNSYQSGCEGTAISLYRGIIKLMGIFAIVVGCIEFAGVFMSFFLASSIRRNELRSYT